MEAAVGGYLVPCVPRGASLFEWCVSTLVKHFLQLDASPSTSHLATSVAQGVKQLPEFTKAHFLKAFRKLKLLSDSTLPFFALAQLSPHVNLRFSRVSEEALFHVAPLWKDIHTFDLSWAGSASNRMVKALCEGPASQTLEFLNLKGSIFINDSCLEHLRLLPRLKKLSLTRCPGISDDGVLILQRVCPQLKYLTLHDLDRTANLTKNLLPSSPAGDNSPQHVPFPNLRVLEVDGSSMNASQLTTIVQSWKERSTEIRKIKYLRSGAARDTACVCEIMRIFCPNLEAPPDYLRAAELPYLLMPLDKCDFESMKKEKFDRVESNLDQFEIDPMAEYPKLKFVQLNCRRSSPAFGIREFIARCTNLKHLVICDSSGVNEFGLYKLDHLQALNIKNGEFTRLYPDSLTQHLRSNERVDCFHSLKRLDLHNARIPVSLLPTLGHLKSLHRLSISCVKFRIFPGMDSNEIEAENRIHQTMGAILEELISCLSELRSLHIWDNVWQHPFEWAISHEKLLRLELIERQDRLRKIVAQFKMIVKEIRCPRLRSCNLQLAAMEPEAVTALMEQVRIGSPWLRNMHGSVLQTALNISDSSQPIPASLHPSVWKAPLAKISLRKCTSLDREGMETLFAALPQLWTFKIEKCKGLGTLNGCRSKSLHSLRIIGGNDLIGEMDFSGFPNLHRVDLQLSRRITSVNLVDLPLLAMISVKSDFQSADLERVIIKGVPMVFELHFEVKAHVPIIFIEAGERLFLLKRDLIFSADSFILRCPSMASCMLQARSWTNKEDDLRALVAGCPNLRELDINRVRGLSSEFLQQLADSAGSAFEKLLYMEADSDELASGSTNFFGNTRMNLVIPTRLKETNAVTEH